MFSSSSGFTRHMAETSRAAYNAYRYEAEQRERAYQVYKLLITKTSRLLFADVKKLKITLDTAITAYLEATKDSWFRQNGRERAMVLRMKVMQAKSTDQLVAPLAELIQAGSDNPDSLKTFVFAKINANFCENGFRYCEPKRVLNDISSAMKVIKTARDKIALCFSGLFSPASDFSRTPKDVVRKITSYLSY